jgi:hypothetical protein
VDTRLRGASMSRNILNAMWPLLLLLGCAGGPHDLSPVRVQGHSRDIRRIAGTWRGEFHSETGRVGAIFFDLKATSETAYGEATFDRVIPTQACTDMTRPAATSEVRVPVVLEFGALATAEGSIGGWFKPYRDPDLSCWMDTWFEGHLRGDTLSGSFFSRRTDIDTVRVGTWWAARRRAQPPEF